jgi:hypothetical protein
MIIYITYKNAVGRGPLRSGVLGKIAPIAPPLSAALPEQRRIRNSVHFGTHKRQFYPTTDVNEGGPSNCNEMEENQIRIITLFHQLCLHRLPFMRLSTKYKTTA